MYCTCPLFSTIRKKIINYPLLGLLNKKVTSTFSQNVVDCFNSPTIPRTFHSIHTFISQRTGNYYLYIMHDGGRVSVLVPVSVVNFNPIFPRDGRVTRGGSENHAHMQISSSGLGDAQTVIDTNVCCQAVRMGWGE